MNNPQVMANRFEQTVRSLEHFRAIFIAIREAGNSDAAITQICALADLGVFLVNTDLPQLDELAESLKATAGLMDSESETRKRRGANNQ